jgi:type I restriction enzyme S subunit
MSWKYKKISECAEVVGGGTPSTKKNEYWQGDIPWISPRDLSKNSSKYITHGDRNISKEGLENSSAKILPSNSLLFSSRAPIGYLAINKKPVATNQGFKSLILKEEHDVEYFYYLFKDRTNYIKSYASGSTFQEVSGSIIKNLKFLIPSFKEQKDISNVLLKFDKKIELNKKMNENLEKIAKTLFKSWFIDFDPIRAKSEIRSTGLSKEISDLFPNSFEDSELGEIPKGWKVSVLSDFGNITCGKTPSTKDPKNFNGSYPFITIPDMKKNLLVSKTARTLSEKGANSLKGKLLPAGSVCVSCIATPGLVCVTTRDSFTNQQINSIVPNSSKHREYLTFSMMTYGNLIASAGSGGSVFANMNTSSFKKLPILVPDNQIMFIFSEIISPILKKIEFLFNETSVLSELRDKLLPRLISGKLRITNEEKSI